VEYRRPGSTRNGKRVPAGPDLYGDVAGSGAYETGKLRGKYEKGYEYEVPCVPLRLDNMPSHSRTENRHGELR
jgi:hypothetical protein